MYGLDKMLEFMRNSQLQVAISAEEGCRTFLREKSSEPFFIYWRVFPAYCLVYDNDFELFREMSGITHFSSNLTNDFFDYWQRFGSKPLGWGLRLDYSSLSDEQLALLDEWLVEADYYGDLIKFDDESEDWVVQFEETPENIGRYFEHLAHFVDITYSSGAACVNPESPFYSDADKEASAPYQAYIEAVFQKSKPAKNFEQVAINQPEAKGVIEPAIAAATPSAIKPKSRIIRKKM